METGEVKYGKVYASLRPPPKISSKHDWMVELGPEVAQRPDRLVVLQFKGSQLNRPNPNPDHDRTGQPVVGRDTNHEPGVPKLVHLMTARASTLKMKLIMTERRNSLLAVT